MQKKRVKTTKKQSVVAFHHACLRHWLNRDFSIYKIEAFETKKGKYLPLNENSQANVIQISANIS